jgi:hypothetical protein
MDTARLQIAARGGAGRKRYQVAHQRRIDRLIEERPAVEPGLDGFEHVHATNF